MLTLDTFLQAAKDEEQGQYRILAELRKIQHRFNQTRLFPELAHLIELYRSLHLILDNAEQVRKGLSRPIKAIDLENKRIIYETLRLEQETWEIVEKTIRWALPKLQEIIAEGIAIGEFVEEQLNVDIVGVLPSYIQEGYVLLPDLPRREYALVRYELTIFTAPDEKYRALKTRIVTRFGFPVIHQPPTQLKARVQQYETEIANPALYQFTVEVDFPFEETLYPIAKRKFLRYLSQFLQ